MPRAGTPFAPPLYATDWLWKWWESQSNLHLFTMKGQMFIQFVLVDPYFFKHFKVMVGEALPPLPPLTTRHWQGHFAYVAVMLARSLHVRKVGQSKEKGKTKQATHISDFHAYGSKSSLWPNHLARWRHQQLPKFSAIQDSGFKPTLKGCEHNRVPHASLKNILKTPEKTALTKHLAQSGNVFYWDCAHVLHDVNS